MSTTRSADSGDGSAPARSFERRALRQALKTGDSYGLLLMLLVVDYVLLTVGARAPWELILRALAVGATVILAFHTSHVRGRWLSVIRGLVVIVIVISVPATTFGQVRVQELVSLVLAALLVTSPVVILNRIMHHERVGPETILGAICVYVIIGILFALIDQGIAAAYGPSHPFFVETSDPTPAQFMYFSYTTMTTTGYGDLTPSTGLPQSAAVLEMLVGQIFLVTLVARLVALFRPRAARFGEPGDGVGDTSVAPPGADDPDGG
jgi:hypothetical protein